MCPLVMRQIELRLTVRSEEKLSIVSRAASLVLWRRSPELLADLYPSPPQSTFPPLLLHAILASSESHGQD